MLLDIDECALNPNLCQYGGICINAFGGYICQCADGFHGQMCEESMQYQTRIPIIPISYTLLATCNISAPCMTSNGGCLNSATCDIVENEAVCSCTTGYSGERCGILKFT